MSVTATQLVTGRIVSGNPFGLSKIISSSTQSLSFYQITIAVNKDTIEMRSFFKKARTVVKQQWPNKSFPSVLSSDFKWNLKEYDGNMKDGKPYVDYCLGCYLIKIFEKRSPLIIMPDGTGGWKPIKSAGEMKTGDYIKVELELIPDSDKASPGLYIKPNYIALFEIGAKVDFERDTAAMRRKMLIARASRALSESPDLVHRS